jgi:sec-independent protein translocase protein TatC
VTPQFLMKQWRFAVVIVAIAAAMITPTVDPFNMGLVMLPLLVLYGLSILLSYLA